MSEFTDMMIEDGFTDSDDYMTYLERKSLEQDMERNDEFFNNSTQGEWEDES